MKDQIASLFRHAVTGAAGAGAALAAHGLINAADAAQVSADTAQAAQLLAGVAATIVARAILGAAGKVPFLRLLGWSKSHASAWLLSGGTAAAFLTLSSCVTAVAPNGTKTTAPDNATISAVGALALSAVEYFFPAPKPEPAPKAEPAAPPVIYRSGK